MIPPGLLPSPSGLRVFRGVGIGRRVLAFAGIGAAMNPGRWNRVGQRVIYTSQTEALVLLELLVGVDSRPGKHIMFEVLIREDTLIAEVGPDNDLIKAAESDTGLPWNDIGNRAAGQQVGGRWYQEDWSPILRFRSSVLSAESNYIIRADAFADCCTIQRDYEFQFDQRLFRESDYLDYVLRSEEG